MISEEKKALRRKVRQLKNEVSSEEKKLRSLQLWKNLEDTTLFSNSQVIVLFWSMEDEVFTHEFIPKCAERKTILLPCIKGNDLELKAFKSVHELQSGDRFGIPEPAGPEFKHHDAIDLFIIPGVAFDKNCQRMGRGKAFYDKLLKTTRAVKAGVCFDFQMFDIVPTDKHDIRMDAVITESGVITCEG